MLSTKYFSFLINGFLLGIVSWLLQIYLFSIFPEGNFSYISSVAISTFLVIILNFFIQSKIIFKRKGSMLPFILFSFFMLVSISILSNIFKWIFDNFFEMYSEYLIYFAYPLAAMILSFISFLLMNCFIFKRGSD